MILLAEKTLNELFIATSDNVSETIAANELETSAFKENVSLAAIEEEAISAMYHDGGADSSRDNSNTMQTAYYLPLSSWVNVSWYGDLV